MKQFVVNKKYENKDVFFVLRKEFPNLNISSLNKVFRLKDVKVNDVRVNKEYILHSNDVVKIYLNDSVLNGTNFNISYVYEDDNIVVAYKPKKIESNFEEKAEHNITFEDLVKKDKGENIKICHRLDVNTEGLLIFAKNDSSYNEILKGLKEGKISKQYITLVFGKPQKNNDTLSHYILKDDKLGYSRVVKNNVPGSKHCVTKYELLKYYKLLDCSILKITLLTGRTHQIRAHTKYISHPIIGDPKYSTNEINDKFKLYSQVLYASKYMFNFDSTSFLYYLNNINIDITYDIINKIEKLIVK